MKRGVGPAFARETVFRKGRYLAVTLAYMLAACSGGRRDWIADLAPAPADKEAEWRRYQWYYPWIKTALEIRQVSDGYYSGPEAYVHYYFAAKALTRRGCDQVGVLRFPYVHSQDAGLQVVRIDSTGLRTDVSGNEMLTRFRAQRTVVVPQITQGTTVAVHITEGPYTGIDYWEDAFSMEVPVYRRSMEVTAQGGVVFGTKGYGLSDAKVEKLGFLSGTRSTWSADCILPLASLPYADGMNARPRFLLTNRNNYHGTLFNDWSAVAAAVKKQRLAAGLLGRGFEARKRARELARGADDDKDKAARILAWVQDNLSAVPDADEAQSPDALLEKRAGDCWHLCLLLQTMLSEAGLAGDIVVTRLRRDGGFDAETVNPQAAELPLVVVAAGGREWAACPYRRDYGLGDYDEELFGMPALSLAAGRPRTLPEPVHAVSRLTVSEEVWLDAAPKRKAVVELEGPFAAHALDFEAENPQEDALDRCRALLANLGIAWSVRACAEDEAQPRGRLKLSLTLDPTGAWVEAQGARVWSLPDLFSRPAWFYDSARVDDYFLPSDQVRNETVVFHGDPGRRMRIDVPCTPSDLPAFKAACSDAPLRGEPAFARETVFRKGRYTAVTLAARRRELADLDAVRQARILAR